MYRNLPVNELRREYERSLQRSLIRRAQEDKQHLIPRNPRPLEIVGVIACVAAVVGTLLLLKVLMG